MDKVTTNYNRYLDLHLCSSTYTAEDEADEDCNFFNHRGSRYRYDFIKDMQAQANYRGGKDEGYSGGNMRVLDSSELTHSQKSFLRLTPQDEISQELSRLRYVSCLVSIERLGSGTHPQLRALVKWISDPCTTNKLRINCHGGGDSQTGFLMGGQISPQDFVEALVRHGLTRAVKTAQNVQGLAHNARWKRDSEISKCEKCNQPFEKTWYGSSTKHHCRRCGSIFCDTCSSWKIDLDKALVDESNKTAKVSKARVCQRCYEDAMSAKAAPFGARSPERGVEGSEDKYGLQTINLALCMGAKGDHDFSVEHGRSAIAPGAHDGFVAGSLASRLLTALRSHQLTGIKVTASNQLVSGSTGRINNSLMVKYPTDLTQTKMIQNKKSFTGRPTFDFPAKVWGSSRILERAWDLRARTSPNDMPTSADIALYRDTKSLAFGAVDGNQKAFAWLQDEFLQKWGFGGWVIRRGSIFSAPSPRATRYDTVVIMPPHRVEKVELRNDTNNNQRVFLTGRQGVEAFKDYKSYGVS